jgi:hypothetical protein
MSKCVTGHCGQDKPAYSSVAGVSTPPKPTPFWLCRRIRTAQPQCQSPSSRYNPAGRLRHCCFDTKRPFSRPRPLAPGLCRCCFSTTRPFSRPRPLLTLVLSSLKPFLLQKYNKKTFQQAKTTLDLGFVIVVSLPKAVSAGQNHS